MLANKGCLPPTSMLLNHFDSDCGVLMSMCASPFNNLQQESVSMPQSACERCRGQKLRCIRTLDSQTTCNRCEKAGAQCYVDPTIRMGRPLRDKNRPREIPKGQQRMSLLTASSDTSMAIGEHQPGNNATHPIAGDGDSTLNDFSAGQFPPYALDFDEPMAWDDEARLFGGENDLDNSMGFASSGFPTPTGFESYDLSSNTRSSSDLSSFKTTPGLEPNAGENGPAESLEDVKEASSHQVYVEQLSKLNMELYQHANDTSVTTDKCTLDGCEFYKPGNEKDLSQLIGTMVQGLQNFHTVLGSIIVSHPPADPNNPMSSNSSIYIQKSNSMTRSAGWKHSESSSANHFHNADGRTNIIPALSGGQQEALPLKSFGSNNLTAQRTELNMPISLVVISCYINLVQLSRNVLVSIRCILTTSDSQWIFKALSSGLPLQICGVSLNQDSELQILLLVQVVVRLLRQIESLLGFGFDEGNANVDEERQKNVISPQLLNDLLEEKKRHGNGAIHTIREEIQKLNYIVAKHA